MKHRSWLEDGATLAELLVVIAIAMAGILCAVTLSGGGHGGSRSETMADLLGVLDRAHNLASANGATIQVAPSASGPGSDVAVFDAYSGGNVVSTLTTQERLGGYCVGTSCASGAVVEAFSLRIRRDGSFIGDVGSGDVGATSVTIGIDDGGQVREAYTIDASDLHASIAADS